MPVTKELLSGSTNGRLIKVAATSTPGTTIHTADSSANDEIFLWAVNTSTSAVKLTIEKGGTTSPDDLIEQTIQPEDGLELVIPGTLVTGSVVVRAFAGTTNVINIDGFVHRHP